MPKPKTEMTFTACKKCGHIIHSVGLCDYECEFDSLTPSARQVDMMENRVYVLTRIEPYSIPAHENMSILRAGTASEPAEKKGEY